ncbi:PREDICTED: probable protein phosphatase 2C 58 isoform X1 [Ipomoea nil]|uniref:probable protein phosphatase 2C 58 isoform X1 n=1 Tax=Ipomoea nil TaxID=35883 RepID=UPI000900B2EB|nr:PREDICTED: probable protein phosphatase 2C 58 isoform X1 [Ipomoea nil]
MEEHTDFVRFKRGKLRQPKNIIKIKRTSTPDDVAAVLAKERNRDNNKHTKGDDEEDEAKEYGDVLDFGGEVSGKNRHITHGFHLVEGKMKHGMEDFLVAENRKMKGYDLGLYAIFDGHSGRKVAQYLHTHLFHNILKEVIIIEPDFWENPASALKRAYKKTDNEILKNVVGARGGSTAVTAILINQKQLVVANVGDSRAVLCRNGEVKQITVDHDPLKRKEKKMVESKGGFVSEKPGNIPRVDGQLAMTRAFGDAKLKEHITVEPDVTIEKIDKETEFIVLASDGLWKVTSNEEVADCIREMKSGQKAAEELIEEALLRGSKDDISCVVVKLG